MKKTLIALAALASTAAFAQSSVTLSGNISTAYERTDIADAQITTYDTGTNRVIFSGVEDLGGGLKAGFHIQNRFNSDTGTNANASSRAFEELFVSLSGGFGSVRVGRFQAFSNARFDAFTGVGLRPYNTYGYNSYTHNRVDKAIAYDSPTFSGFTIGAQTTATAGSANEYTVVRAMYQNGPLDVQVSYEINNDTFDTTLNERKDYAIGASYNFGIAKAMFLHGKEKGAKGATSVGVTVPFGAALFKAQYRTQRYQAPGSSQASLASGKTLAIGVDYALSKRTVLFADAADTKGNAQSVYRIGVRHSF